MKSCHNYVICNDDLYSLIDQGASYALINFIFSDRGNELKPKKEQYVTLIGKERERKISAVGSGTYFIDHKSESTKGFKRSEAKFFWGRHDEGFVKNTLNWMKGKRKVANCCRVCGDLLLTEDQENALKVFYIMNGLDPLVSFFETLGYTISVDHYILNIKN